MLKSDKKSLAKDLAKAMKDVFKKYTYQSRVAVWDTLQKGAGKKQVELLIQHPDRPLSFFTRLSFKDWMNKDK